MMRRQLETASVSRSLLAGVVVGVSATLAMGTTEAGAQARPVAVPGTASATAKAFNFGAALNGGIPGEGSTLGVTRGLASADSKDATGVSKGRAFDLGLVANYNRDTPPGCPPVVPLYDRSTTPVMSQAESGDPSAQTSRPLEVRYPAMTPGAGTIAGTQDAVAGPGASARGNTTIPEAEGLFLKATGLNSETSTTVDGAGRRSATSTVTAAVIDVGGWFSIGNARFAAMSNTDGTSAASFTYDWVYFLGQYHTGAAAERAMQDGKALGEGLLAGLGVKIDLPVASRPKVVADPSSDTTRAETVEVSPLRVRVANAPIGRDVLRPLLDAIGPSIDQQLAEYLDGPCADRTLSNSISVTTSLLSGTGQLGTSIGFVSAATSDRWVYIPPRPTTTIPAPTNVPDNTVLPVTIDGSSAGNTFVAGSTGRRSSSGATAVAPTPVPVTPPATTIDQPPPKDDPPSLGEPETTELAVVPSVGNKTSAVRELRGGRLMWVALALLGGVLAMALADRLVLAKRRVS